jgi:solute carrier family 25 thiamine pyrophosphate transporter 19
VRIQPIDVIKTRIQVQVEPIFAGKYRGIIQSTKLISKEEGLIGFWRGHIPGQALSVVFSLVNFSTFEIATKKLRQTGLIRDRKISDFVSGSIAGTFATIASMPLTVLKTRMISQGEPKIYANSMHAARELWRFEGASGFFRGTVPSVVQVAPYTGLVFFMYNFLNVNWNKFIRKGKFLRFFLLFYLDPIGTMVCGAAAGAFSKTALYPFDLIRYRLQVTPYEERSFGKAMRLLLHVVRNEGTFGLYKGLSPSLVKVVLHSACIFSFYEMFCNVFRKI